MATTNEAATPPPPVIGKAGSYTVFITPPATPRTSEGSRSQNPTPSPSPRVGPRNVESFRSLSSRSSEKMRPKSNLRFGDREAEKSPAVAPPPPPVVVPPPRFEKGRSSGSVFGFFWDAVAKVQDAHSCLDKYVADWLGLDKSRYQWALNDYYENNGTGKDGGKAKELVSKGEAV